MRTLLFTVIIGVCLAWAASAFAALPYYNQDLGYTIWLADGWEEAPDSLLSRFSDFHDGVAHGQVGWEAGYVLEDDSASLLVCEIHGKVVSKSSINNFNRHVVRELMRRTRAADEWQNKGRLALKDAQFDSGKNTLRLEMETSAPGGDRVTSIVYIVYTATGMLKFVGVAEPGDVESVQAIDKAVATLYLDYGLNR